MQNSAKKELFSTKPNFKKIKSINNMISPLTSTLKKITFDKNIRPLSKSITKTEEGIDKSLKKGNTLNSQGKGKM
jgi:hypothetical protein